MTVSDRREPSYRIPDAERKRAVANAVFDDLNRVCAVLQGMGDVMEVQAYSLGGPLQRVIRVKTRDAGTHYYTVQIKEQM